MNATHSPDHRCSDTSPNMNAHSQSTMEYYIDPTTRFPHETTKWPGMNPVMPILEAIFDPTGTQLETFRDCVLISLDTEYNSQTHEISQIGVASLDTRAIAKADDLNLAPRTLNSRLMLLHPVKFKRRSLYLYGQSEKCYGRNLQTLVRPIFEVAHSDDTKEFRNVILIGHGIASDIQEIRRSSNFNIMSLPMIKAVIDTSPLLSSVFNTTVRCHTLRQTCKMLGMYRRDMHIAGNDAMYTLKALLLLYCHYKEEKLLWDLSSQSADWILLHQCHIEAIRRIGRCNNGKSRSQKKLELRSNTLPRLKRDKTRDCDVLATEFGALDGLFLHDMHF